MGELMQITTTLEVARGDETIVIEATGVFLHDYDDSYEPNHVCLEEWNHSPDISLSDDEREMVVQKLYDALGDE